MDEIAAALGDGARWRMVELLAERPRSVGELAELTGLRQPQTTKHLQTLARAGLVTVFPLGQRRVYAAEPAPLAALADTLRRLVGTLEAAEAAAGDRDVLARYRAAIEADTAAAVGPNWADGRTLALTRDLPAPRALVWRHWVDPVLAARWWAPPSLTVVESVLEPRPGGRAVLEYRDADGRYRSEGRVHAAEPGRRLDFDLSVLDPAGRRLVTVRHLLSLTDEPGGTRLRLDLTVGETTVEAVPYVAGIETGWGQVLDHLTDILTDKDGPS